MAAIPNALLALCSLAFVAECSRRTAADLREPELAASEWLSAAAGPLRAEALLEGRSPRQARRTPAWQLLKRLPLLVGASPLAGELAFPRSGGRGPGSPTLPSEAFASDAPAAARSPLAGVAGRPARASIRAALGEAASQRAVGRSPRRTLPAVLAVRGGSATAAGDGDKQDAANHEGARGGSLLRSGSPRAGRFPISGRAATFWNAPKAAAEPAALWPEEDFQHFLLQEGFLSLTENPEQLWRFEFRLVPDFGFGVEISFSEVWEPRTRKGADFIVLSPRSVLGRFRGFEGTDGIVRYRFSPRGTDMLVDITHPLDGLARHNWMMLASPILNEYVAPSQFPPPSQEVRDAFRLNIFRHAWPILPMGQHLIDFLEQPGDWHGGVQVGEGHEEHALMWRIEFGSREGKLVSVIDTQSDLGVAKHLVMLEPYFIDGVFQGLYGKHADNGPRGLMAEYLFQAQSGIMFMQVHHHLDAIVQDELMLKFHVPLVLIPEGFF